MNDEGRKKVFLRRNRSNLEVKENGITFNRGEKDIDFGKNYYNKLNRMESKRTGTLTQRCL